METYKRKEIPGFFVDWEEEIEDQLNEDHENVLKCVGADELPF